FESIFDNPLTLRSIYNAVEVGVITAVVGGALAFAIGYTIHRTNVTGRRSIDLVSTLPVAIPGLVVGVAYLWAWIASPGVLAAMTLLFVLAIRELGSSLFLYTSNTMVMSVLLLDYYEGGNLGK